MNGYVLWLLLLPNTIYALITIIVIRKANINEYANLIECYKYVWRNTIVIPIYTAIIVLCVYYNNDISLAEGFSIIINIFICSLFLAELHLIVSIMLRSTSLLRENKEIPFPNPLGFFLLKEWGKFLLYFFPLALVISIIVQYLR
jgi:hypothetical protein